MPVLAEYNSGRESYGRSADAFLGGMEQGQSMMARSQAMRLREEQAQQQRVEFQAKLPAIQAAAQADLASAHASVENAALMEQFRAKAASESKDLNAEYLSAIQLPSFEEQSKALSALQPRIAYMDTLPEYKGFVLAVNNATVRAHGSAQLDRQLNNKLDMQGAKNDAAAELLKYRADIEAQRATERAAHAKELAEARAQAAQLKVENTGSVAYHKKRGEEMAAMVADVQSKVPTHYSTIDQINRARLLLDKDTEQGRGLGTVLGVEQAINSFIPGTFDTANQEALKNTYAEMALTAAAKMKGQGQITEAERSLLADTVAKFGNSPEGARYIMDFMEAVAKREIARGDYFSELEDGGEMVTSKRNTDFYRQHALGEYLNSSIKQAPDQEMPSQPTAQPTSNPQKPVVIKSIRRVE